MAISHLGRSVNIYKEDGTWIELTCDTDEQAAMLAHNLLDVLTEMIIRLDKEETEDGPNEDDRRIPQKVRIGRFGKPSFSKR